MTNDETDTTKAPPWSMVDSSSDRRHGDMDGDDDTDDDADDDTDDDTDDDIYIYITILSPDIPPDIFQKKNPGKGCKRCGYV